MNRRELCRFVTDLYFHLSELLQNIPNLEWNSIADGEIPKIEIKLGLLTPEEQNKTIEAVKEHLYYDESKLEHIVFITQ